MPEHTYNLTTEQLLQMLIRFKHSLETVGVLAFDTERETAEAFLRADRNAMIRAAADDAPDPRFT
jgi:hypothetical protein